MIGDRDRVAAGLWFCGSVCWALAVALVFATIGMVYVAGSRDVSLDLSFVGLMLAAVFGSAITGYALKGFALLVEKP